MAATRPLKSAGEQLRQVGRPRSRPAEADALDAHEHILEVAGTLFSSQGYSATSTRQIAEIVGLRQASLFHYFEKKEDILSELLYRTLRPALSLSNWLDSACTDPFVALYCLAKFDCLTLASSPNNVAALQLLPEVRAERRFEPFWNDRDALRTRYGIHVHAIVGSIGISVEPELSCDLILGLVESVLTWLDHDGGPRPDIVATAVADASMRIIGAPARRLPGITRQARVLLARYASES